MRKQASKQASKLASNQASKQGNLGGYRMVLTTSHAIDGLGIA